MDAQGKRKLFIGVAGGIVVLVGALAIWGPTFPSEDASGAIGAVEKHREQQITDKDVILADQGTVTEAKILFSDYLEDAAALQNIGAELGTMVAFNKLSLEHAVSSLESRQSELQARFTGNMTETINAMQELLASRGESAVGHAAELQAIENALGAKLELNQMEQLNARLGAVAADLQAKGILGDRMLQYAKLETDLASAFELASRDASMNNKAAEMLGAVSAQLNDKSMIDASLSSRVDYLAANVSEAQALGRMTDSLNAVMSLESRDGAELQNRLGAVISELGKQAASLEAKAADNLQNRLGAHGELAARLEHMQSMLGAHMQIENKMGADALGKFSQSLESMTAELQSRVVANRGVELQAIEAHLSNVEALQARFANAANLENRGANLDNRGSNLENRGANLGAAANLENRGSNLGSAANLENRGSNLGAAANLENRGSNLGSRGASLFNRESLGSFASYLEAARSLESKVLSGLGSKSIELQNRSSELQSRSSELQNRATELQSVERN